MADLEIKNDEVRAALDAAAAAVDRANALTRAFRTELERAQPDLLAGFDETIAAWRANSDAVLDAAQTVTMPLVRASQEMLKDG